MNIKYILKGHKAIPVDDVIEWGKCFETADKIVKQEKLADGKYVSTVFIGIDYSFGRRKPLCFETIVFESKDDFIGLDVDRYSTWEEAEKGHKEMVKKWKTKIKPSFVKSYNEAYQKGFEDGHKQAKNKILLIDDLEKAKKIIREENENNK